MPVSEHADTEEFCECGQSDCHDEGQARCSQRDGQFCSHQIHLHSLKQGLKDIPFAHKPRLRRQCRKTHRGKERAHTKQDRTVAQ